MLKNLKEKEDFSMTIFRHKATGTLYTITILIHDIWHLNRNGFRGAHANPYKHNGYKYSHTFDNSYHNGEPFNPEQWVNDNFKPVAIV